MSQQDNQKTDLTDMSREEAMTVDCLGDICPVPLMKFKTMKRALKEGREVMLVTDHSCAAENILDYCRSLNYAYTVEEPISGVWEITVHQNPDPPAGTDAEGEFPDGFEDADDEYEEDAEEDVRGSIWHW